MSHGSILFCVLLGEATSSIAFRTCIYRPVLALLWRVETYDFKIIDTSKKKKNLGVT